jgi:hypothetical protein
MGGQRNDRMAGQTFPVYGFSSWISTGQQY